MTRVSGNVYILSRVRHETLHIKAQRKILTFPMACEEVKSVAIE